MRFLACICCAVVIVGCSKSQDEANTAADSAAAAAAPAPPRPAISLADVAGNWTARTMTETSDSVLITYDFIAKADTAGWAIKFPNKPDPVAVYGVTPLGDSIVYHAGPYSSALRKGVTVTIDAVTRLQDGKLVGRINAHYKSTAADSLAVFRTEATRAQ